MTTTAFITHRDCQLHDMGSYHPECPARLTAISDQMIAQGLDPYFSYYDAPLATLEQMLRAHSPAYLERLKRTAPENGIAHLDPDTAMNPHTWTAAQRSAGAGVMAVDLVLKGEATDAFCAIRPPGHHAERENCMGFCFVNNIAVAARHALEVHGLKRVAIVDFDVHHGNGTEEIFQNDPRVMMVSIFQHPFYPYCGDVPLGPNMHNVPMKAGSGSSAFREAVEMAWLPNLEAFQPQMLFISAGFDAHREDEMGSMGLTESDYEWVTRQLMRVARTYCEGRIVSVLEGGYDLSALARSVAAHVRVLSAG